MLADFLRKGKPGNAKTYVEDVFSTFLYNGNGGTQNIVNGIDLAGKGGMVWFKDRSRSGAGNALFDTANTGYFLTPSGNQTYLLSTAARQSAVSSGVTFNSNGFSLGTDTAHAINNYYTTDGYVSWTFRKAPKFFDVVTYTGNGVDGKSISHSLGVAPGMIVVKCTSTTGNWTAWHRGASGTLWVNSTNADSGHGGGQAATGVVYNPGSSTTAFTVDAGVDVNTNGATYVAYLFAHDTSADGLIQCGSFTTDSSGNASVTLGWEPQFLITKLATSTSPWAMYDCSRAFSYNSTIPLTANTSNAEGTNSAPVPTATGFTNKSGQAFAAAQTYIYLAIRRGPMRTPTSGTQVYNAIARTGTGGTATVTGMGFPPDFVFSKYRNGASNDWRACDRLRGANMQLSFDSTQAEVTSQIDTLTAFQMDGYTVGADASWDWNNSGYAYIQGCLRRYPGVFDIVCFTGTGAANQRVSHSLGVIPEMLIVKSRAGSGTSWEVYHSSQPSNQCGLNTTSAFSSGTSTGHNIWGTSPASHTSNDFGIDTWWTGLSVTDTHVAYLFATLSGISKVGSYTGNGTSQTINCGFSAGARFALIKRTDSTGDWYVWDSVRGIVAANDPHLSLNTTAAEVTTDDSIDPDPSGFIVNQNTATNINVNAAAYIYLAFA